MNHSNQHILVRMKVVKMSVEFVIWNLQEIVYLRFFRHKSAIYKIIGFQYFDKILEAWDFTDGQIVLTKSQRLEKKLLHLYPANGRDRRLFNERMINSFSKYSKNKINHLHIAQTVYDQRKYVSLNVSVSQNQ